MGWEVNWEGPEGEMSNLIPRRVVNRQGVTCEEARTHSTQSLCKENSHPKIEESRSPRETLEVEDTVTGETKKLTMILLE